MYKFKLHLFIIIMLLTCINSSFANTEFDKQSSTEDSNAVSDDSALDGVPREYGLYNENEVPGYIFKSADVLGQKLSMSKDRPENYSVVDDSDNRNSEKVQAFHGDPVYIVGGMVFGLRGTVEIQNKGAETLIIGENGQYEFLQAVSGTEYDIEIITQPTEPNQECEISNPIGTIDDNDVNNVNITCTTNQYNVGVMVNNLAVGSSVVLFNNGEGLEVYDDNIAYFKIPVVDHSSYGVTILSQPVNPIQECSVNDGKGIINGMSVIVAIDCEYIQHTLGINTTGLNGSVTLQNEEDMLIINENSVMLFNTTYDNGSDYFVTVSSQPEHPNQICTIDEPQGMFSGNDIILNMHCVTQQYTLGVNVMGLESGSELSMSNGQQNLIISSNGVTLFSQLYDDGLSYILIITGQPSKQDQICSISTPIGDFDGENIIVDVTCSADTYFIGGSIIGLEQNSSIDLNLSTGQNLFNVINNTFIFTTPLDNNTEYVVSVLNQPTQPNQECEISNASGTVNGADISDILVNCETLEYIVGFTVTGLITGNSITVQNNNTDDRNIVQDGVYLFATPITDLLEYSVTIISQANNPMQDCVLSNASGNVNGQDVDNVMITCQDSEELIFIQGFE